MNLIILHKEDATGDNTYSITDHRAEHIRTVIKSIPGDTLNVGLLNGPTGTAVIESIEDDRVTLTCTWLPLLQSLPTIDLICALPRPQTLKKVLASAAAMGIRRIHLVNAERVKQRYFKSSLLHYEKYKRFLLEGLSQGKRTNMPEIKIYKDFDKFFNETLPELEDQEQKPAIRLLPDPETDTFINSIKLTRDDRILLAIGPEGGWIPPELNLIANLGFHKFSLGRWILRVENAVVAALSQIELMTETAADRPPQ
ncbi:MAG TPA: 16S rRNA (uracil(1498)-N(3))-methyltransferase [Phycisphaerales bacterium]|nr:16S rRNA (uracil(1498)-N(3))-methyltransferase [Phycisphaerales bacterium]